VNFLALAEKTRKWSGTSSTTIANVASQTGQTALIIDAVGQAWELIQTKHLTWNWLRSEFEIDLTAVTPPSEARYTPSALGITRFSDWYHDRKKGANPYRAFTLYLTATGRADEGILDEISFDTWKVKYGRGVVSADRPTEWAMAPDCRLCLGKPPSAPYTLKGEFWKGPQTMAVNDDVPEMPERFHMAIVHRAALLLHEKDEADNSVFARNEAKYTEIMAQLERDQLPPVTIAGNPLA